ncbi:MAG: hypothetical protein M1821_002997 [Bathelium mastoideum]|nr:MAG: hypothetical protein M1821_002997 [Bathelium mastoideum]
MERHYRASSPGARRLTAPPERASTGNVSSYDPVYYSRGPARDIYNPPRGGSTDGGVIPISTTTYVSNRPPAITRNGSNTGIDPYTGRPRRSTLTEADAVRGNSSHRSGSSRTRPAVIQGAVYDQPKSPRSATDREYLITPSTSGSVRGSHKKVYSVDDGKSRLVDDNLNRKKRDSIDRSQYSTLVAGGRGKNYHLSGPARSQGSLDDYTGYSYTDPAGMYRDTEPRWRSRRGSVESSRRDRPVSMLEAYPPKPTSDRQLGPPPSTRGFDKIPDNLQRTSSLSNGSRPPVSYELQPYDAQATSNGYALPARPASARPQTTVHQDPPQRYSTYPEEYERESRRPTRKVEDTNVESRGFGIRSGSIDRYAPRETSLDRRNVYHADPLISEPDLRRYIPEPSEPFRREPDRREPDRREREYVREMPKERERPRERDRERDREWDREPVRDRERDRDRDREREKERERERDREREREREREKERERERDRDRDHEKERRRRDDDTDRKHRDRERHRERDRDDRERDEGKSHFPGVGAAAAALGAAALGGEVLRDRKRDKEREYEEDDDRSRHTRKPELREDLDVDRRLPIEEPRERVDRKPSPRESASDTSDPDADYRRRVAQIQQEMQQSHKENHDDSSQSDDDKDRKDRRRRERRERREREIREREEFDKASERSRDLEQVVPVPPANDERRQSTFDAPLVSEPDSLNDGSSSTRESRVRIVEPPKDDKDEPAAPKSILRKPTEKFPEDPNPIREGVAPLKDASKKGIPPGARWTKIDRRLVNPEALEDAKERFEERLDCVIVLRVLSRDEIQKFADRTKEIRDERYDRERKERKQRRREERDRDPEASASHHRHHRRHHSRTESSDTGTNDAAPLANDGRRRAPARDRGTDGALESTDGSDIDGDYSDSADERPKAIEAPPQPHTLPPQFAPPPASSSAGLSFAPEERGGTTPVAAPPMPWANGQGGGVKEDVRR